MPMLMPIEEDSEEEGGDGEEDLPEGAEGEEAAILVLDAKQE